MTETQAEPTTIGVMFDLRGEFPTLGTSRAQVGYEWHGIYSESMPEELSGWRAVAYDPHSLTYGDDDREAMDETNFDVIRDDILVQLDVDELPLVCNELRGHTWQLAEVALAVEARACMFGHVLALAPDATDALDVARELSASLSNYPLLDESAYSERDWEAWQEYAPTALHDEIRDAVRDETLSDDDADKLEELESELLPLLAQHLDYSNGFTGEYGPNFLDVLADLAARARVLPPVGQESLLPVEPDYRDNDARAVRELLGRAGVDLSAVCSA